MKFLTALLLALACLSETAGAQSSVPGGFYGYGYGGRISCATWLSSDVSYGNGREWILGYWTGRNAAAARTPEGGGAGESTDEEGIVGEIRLVCEAAPSTKLLVATDDVYRRFEAEGR